VEKNGFLSKAPPRRKAQKSLKNKGNGPFKLKANLRKIQFKKKPIKERKGEITLGPIP